MPMFEVEIEITGTRKLTIEAMSESHVKVIVADKSYSTTEYQDFIEAEHILEVKRLS